MKKLMVRGAEFVRGEPSDDSKDPLVFDLVWSTGAEVKRTEWATGKQFMELLEVSESAIDMTRLNGGAPVLRDHWAETQDVVGVVERAWVDTSGDTPVARATIRMSARQEVSGMVQDIKDGILRNISVGYRVTEWKIARAEKGEIERRTAVKWVPMEISVVAVGADSKAGFNRSEEHSDYKEENEMHREQELDQRKLPEQTVTAPAPAPVIDVDALVRKAQSDERTRVSEISTLCRKHDSSDLQDALINEGASVDQARAAILKKIEDRAPVTHPAASAVAVRGGLDEGITRRDALGEAMYCRMANEELKSDAHELARSFVNASVVRIAAQCLESAGVRDVNGMANHEIVQRAMESTSDFPILLGTNVNRMLLKAYMLAPQTYGPLTENDTVQDFRTVEMLRTGSIGTPTQLVEGGELKYVALDDAGKETARLLTYGNKIKVTRQLLVNDDLGGIRRLINAQGESMNRLEGDLAWAQITSNPTMGDGVVLFHTDHGNIDGSGAALSNASLAAARLAMRLQTEPNGLDYLNLAMTHLIIPPDLEQVANSLLRNKWLPTQASNTVEDFFRGLPLIVEPRLTTADANAWYAVSIGANKPLIRFTLAGASQPVTAREVKFGTGDLEVAIRHDVAFKVADWRTLYKNIGA